MYEAIQRFRDRFTDVIYEIGDEYGNDKKSRIAELVKKGFIKEVEEKKPKNQRQ